MKLGEYLNFKNNHNEIIDINKYEILCHELSSKKSNIHYESLTFETDILEKLDDKITIFLSSNPDQDFPNPKKFIFDTGNQSQEETDKIKYLDRLNLNQLNYRDNLKIFCHSVGKLREGITMIPIGRDFKNKNYFKYVDKLKKNNKNILCYYNCTIPPDVYHWYSNPRKNILDLLLKKDFVKVEECNVNPRVITKNKTINYFNNLSRSKFMVCPRGCGIDTYRMWDCIYLGCIPIVEKFEGYNQFEDLPILFLNDWKELEDIDEDFLEKNWKEMFNKDYNYEKLKMSYWINKILN